ncbi:MAG: hypothetical protein WEB00_01625 [Dehalococcoidia bacterium]
MSQPNLDDQIQEGDKAVSGLDRTAEGTDQTFHEGTEKANNALDRGEEWAEDRTQDAFDAGPDVLTA